jgi:hypothetical protein
MRSFPLNLSGHRIRISAWPAFFFEPAKLVAARAGRRSPREKQSHSGMYFSRMNPVCLRSGMDANAGDASQLTNRRIRIFITIPSDKKVNRMDDPP